MLSQRAADGIEDLAIAARLMSAAWSAGAPYVAGTPAAIEWWYALTDPEPLGDHLRLWFDDGEAVAWSWHESPEVEWHVWSGDETRDQEIFATIVDAALDEARGGELGVFAADHHEAAITVLRERGFSPAGRVLTQWHHRVADPLASAPLPGGYRIRGLRGPEEFDARVALHRAAFPTSRLNVAKYERLMTVPHYRLEDDLVVEAPDGSLAAFALTWWDPEGQVGELEPVGTHPSHQRRGLSRAVIAAAVASLRDRGVTVVQVYSDASEGPAEALYPAAGFARRATHRRYAIGSSDATGATIGA
ncbi:MAG TPA: GNAT family N-acetyltransferase [Candidatus Limnocylindrales bacterium]|nr:GNAT family N-acetyltransferase [Candidatus Limnocylindrales bacterium]